MKQYGLDLSVHNDSLDFEAIKAAGHDFVILRAGYGRAISQKDKLFEEHYKKAKAAGLKVGAYWYSYALNTAHALEEAKVCLKAIKGKSFEYPVYIDMEDADGYKKKNGMPSNETLSAICETFCEHLEANGYYVGIYASESWLKNQLAGVVSKNKYDLWCANWGTNDGTLQADKSGTYRLHQFTSMYTLGGKRFDRNVCYFDYPGLITSKGFNGFSGGSTAGTDKPASSTGSVSTDTKYHVGDTVTINGVYVSSTSKEKLTPSVKSGKITKIIAGAANPYLLNDGNIGWVNDSCIVGKGSTAAAKPKMRKGAKVKYSGYVYADSYGNGRGSYVSGTYSVTIYNSNPYGAHLNGLGWVKPGDCTVIG